MIGNPRDEWVCGAIGSASGSAALLEIARNFGELLQTGWRPRRSIKLGSWDGEAFGQIGSTEYAEDNARELLAHAVAYIRVVSVRGSIVGATSSPLLADFVYETAKSVPANRFFGNETEATLYEQWVNQAKHYEPPSRRISNENLVRSIGSNADYTAFYHHLGIPSSNLVFAISRDVTFGAFHSALDSPVYLAKFGDPQFLTQATTATWWGLQTMRLASERIVPFDLTTFGSVLRSDVDLLANQTSAISLQVDLGPLRDAVAHLSESITQFHSELSAWKHALATGEADDRHVACFNRKLVYFERQFLADKGLPHRPWFRNIASGSPFNEGYNGIGFPGLSDAILFEDDAMLFQRHVEELAVAVHKAAVDLLDN